MCVNVRHDGSATEAGAHAAGLHTAATGVKVGFDDNAGAYHVAQCAREFLDICECFHKI